MPINRKTFFILGLITLFGFGALGLLMVHFFQARSIWSLLTEGRSIPYQLYRGGLFGIIAAGNMLWLIETPLLGKSRRFFSDLIRKSNLQWSDLLFLSLAAGIGEELLFRAGIQPFLGIWITAVIFVAIHGYLNPLDWKMSIYGILMVVISGGLGYLYAYVGLFAAMMAHFLIDAILFARFKYWP